MKDSTVAVVGLGYVGLPLAILAAEKGHKVIGVDREVSKVKTINDGVSPILDEYVSEQLAKYPISATTDVLQVKEADVVLVCVPTPVNGITPDLGPLKGAVTDVAKHLKKGALLIIESTINPGVCDDVVIPILQTAGLTEDDYLIAHCPERINPGDKKWTVRNINRVVGSNSTNGLKKAVAFYKSILEAEIKPMGSLKEAEAVKVVENSFRDINIAFVNELAMSFSRMGIDIENVIDGCATKPFAFMPHRPGVGVGGHCIPVDPYYLIEYARSFGFEHDFLSLARRINSRMPEYTVETLQDKLNEVSLPMKGTKVALLGLAYKSNVDDDRESPAYEVEELLRNHGADLSVFDPYVLRNSTVDNIDDALSGASAVLIATAHNDFANLDAGKLASQGVKVIIDGRNLLRHRKDEFASAGIVYSGIGI